MPYRAIIAKAYDAGVEEEYNRLTGSILGEAEFLLITELMDEYIPNGSTVIDVGSGPGRYAEYLLKRNCKVGVVDLSAKSLKAFSDRISNSSYQQNILFNRVSCATELSWITSKSADAILLMGPLYHLIYEEHRNKALYHCNRILKPGGYLFSVFLSPFPLFCQQDEDYHSSYLFPDKNLYKYIHSDIITHTHFQGFEVPQFRCWPKDARKLMLTHKFIKVRIRNIEGIGTFHDPAKLQQYSEPHRKQAYIATLRSWSENEELIGITHQYLYVGRSLKDS